MTELKPSISQINKRLTALESGIILPKQDVVKQDVVPSTSSESAFLQHLKKQKELEQKEIEQQVQELYQKEITAKGIDITNKLDILDFTIDFVEKIIEYIPKIVILVGSAFKGQFKLSLALDLIKTICEDIDEWFGNGLLEQTINKIVNIKFNSKGKVQAIDYKKNTTTERGGEYSNGECQTSEASTSQVNEGNVKGNKKKGGFLSGWVGRTKQSGK